MKSGAAALTLGVFVLVLAACGNGGKGETESAGTASMMRDASTSALDGAEGVGAGLPAGCGPRQAADLVSSLADAVAERERDQAIEYLSKGKSFVVITIYHGSEPGAGRVDSRSPAAAYDNLVQTFGAVQNPLLLGSVVGQVAPLEGLRGGAEGDDPTAGVEFALRLDKRTLTGKIGIDCATKTIYLGAMSAKSGLRPEKMCGSFLSMEADRPKICAYPAS